ncbi:restriction endonuclease subunit S [Clostridioides difficile]|nr:restriction endonuclease subunit S [Clostridioides difficile]
MRDIDNKNLWSYWNKMRGAISEDQTINATVLVDEVKKMCQDMNDGETPESVYSALLEAADRIGVINPFKDRDHFFIIYQESKKFSKLDWEGAIEKTASYSKMPVLPTVLVNEYEKRFEKDIEPETVLIAEAERFVPNLQNLVDNHINSKFVLTTQNAVYARAFEKVFEGYENVKVVVTDIYRYGFINSRFDLIFSCPSFGGRTLAEDKNFLCREFDMVALENLSLHLNNGGELVIVLPGRITFASGKINDLRQFIQQNYTIKELAELPEGTMAYTGIKVYLLDIENVRPGDDDIVICRYSADERKNRREPIKALTVTDDTFVMLSELEEQGDWSIDRIFAQQDEDYLKYQKSSVRKDLIGNAAQVFRGKAVTKKDATGNIGVVNISNIGEYDIDYDGLDHLDEEERKVSNYLLQEGDVLLPARGTAIRTAVFHKQPYPCIASSNVIVIRPDETRLNSVYLKIFLDSPLGNKLISGAQQGMTVMNISYKDLNVLEIPMPTLEEQTKKATEYTEQLSEYRSAIAKAEEKWSAVLAKLQSI